MKVVHCAFKGVRLMRQRSWPQFPSYRCRRCRARPRWVCRRNKWGVFGRRPLRCVDEEDDDADKGVAEEANEVLVQMDAKARLNWKTALFLCSTSQLFFEVPGLAASRVSIISSFGQ
ncbi:hypothetical protein GGX14DRAFT_393954 [Mycena pura]|uniref:Uncharacterized protein n=1 Tax=Mycena pura TaxID=153505 RepID=A0AAD6VJS4_9AGAR|nr:hypothetical protein GGX14DRAFT_393954 [Mycena pura]